MQHKAVSSSSKTNSKLRYNKLHKKLRRQVGQAIQDFSMIEEGDRIMVCLSGGKDSYTLLYILQNLQQSAPISFELVAVNLDQKQPGFPEEVLPNYLAQQNIEYKIIQENTYKVVKELIPEGKTTCSLCSRLRRGILYRSATSLNCNKIALGHHRDDAIETLFLNMFYAGKLKSMPAKLLSDNHQHIVIRPLIYVKEKDIVEFSSYKQFPIIPCNLCGSQPNLQRVAVKEMLQIWDKKHPGRIETIFTALQNTSLSHLLDTNLYNFSALELKRKQHSLQNSKVSGDPEVTEDLSLTDLDNLAETELFPVTVNNHQINQTFTKVNQEAKSKDSLWKNSNIAIKQL